MHGFIGVGIGSKIIIKIIDNSHRISGCPASKETKMTTVLNGTEFVNLETQRREAPKLNVVARRNARRDRRANRAI